MSRQEAALEAELELHHWSLDGLNEILRRMTTLDASAAEHAFKIILDRERYWSDYKEDPPEFYGNALTDMAALREHAAELRAVLDHSVSEHAAGVRALLEQVTGFEPLLFKRVDAIIQNFVMKDDEGAWLEAGHYLAHRLTIRFNEADWRELIAHWPLRSVTWQVFASALLGDLVDPSAQQFFREERDNAADPKLKSALIEVIEEWDMRNERES